MRRFWAVATVLALALSAGCSLVSPTATAPIGSPSTAAIDASRTAVASSTTASHTGTATVIASRTVTIGWVGDTTPGSRFGMPPRHGRALFERVRADLRVPDIMVGNLEGTFGSGGPSKSDITTSTGNTYSYQAPPANAKSLAWAGFDLMGIANNHIHDFQEAGMASSEKALTVNGIAYTGLPDQITVLKARGVRVAFIGAAPYRWNQSLENIDDTVYLVERARKRADVVVVIMHAGAEGADKTHTPAGAEQAYGEFRGKPRQFAHAMIDAGASLVLGSGPHVIRGIERYKGRLIAYSLGNFAGWDNFRTSGVSGLSGLLSVSVDGVGKVRGGSWESLSLDSDGVPSPDSSRASLKLLKKLSKADFRDTFRFDAKGDFSAAK